MSNNRPFGQIRPINYKNIGKPNNNNNNFNNVPLPELTESDLNTQIFNTILSTIFVRQGHQTNPLSIEKQTEILNSFLQPVNGCLLDENQFFNNAKETKMHKIHCSQILRDEILGSNINEVNKSKILSKGYHGAIIQNNENPQLINKVESLRLLYNNNNFNSEEGREKIIQRMNFINSMNLKNMLKIGYLSRIEDNRLIFDYLVEYILYYYVNNILPINTIRPYSFTIFKNNIKIKMEKINGYTFEKIFINKESNNEDLNRIREFAKNNINFNQIIKKIFEKIKILQETLNFVHNDFSYVNAMISKDNFENLDSSIKIIDLGESSIILPFNYNGSNVFKRISNYGDNNKKYNRNNAAIPFYNEFGWKLIDPIRFIINFLFSFECDIFFKEIIINKFGIMRKGLNDRFNYILSLIKTSIENRRIRYGKIRLMNGIKELKYIIYLLNNIIPYNKKIRNYILYGEPFRTAILENARKFNNRINSEEGIYIDVNTKDEVLDLIENFDNFVINRTSDYDRFSQKFTPENIIRLFS